MNFDLPRILMALPGVIIGLTFHEFLHAFTASRLGDPTAREQGRLSLNPLRHIDPVGLLFLVLVGFGWAKPVQFNRAALRHPRRDEVLIALSGPAANLALALFLSVILSLVMRAFGKPDDITSVYGVFLQVFLWTIMINYGLFIFNLIPIPPLDGSHLIFAAIRVRPETERKLYKYGSIFFLVVLVTGMFIERLTGTNYIFKPMSDFITWICFGFLHLLGI